MNKLTYRNKPKEIQNSADYQESLLSIVSIAVASLLFIACPMFSAFNLDVSTCESTALTSLKESVDPSVQSDNKLTIVDQVIFLDAPVGCHENSFWYE